MTVTVDDVLDYLGDTSWDQSEVERALYAEAAAQERICRVDDPPSEDLREALMRRVARNLAMRRLPLAVPTGDSDAAIGILPGRDPEVRRLEAPWRKLTVG